MSTPILPFAPWAAGTNQNSVPANDNSLRNQILNGLVISDSTDAQPGSPADGDIYIMTGSATGAQWATFDEFDLAIFQDGTWYAFAPVEGIIVNIAGAANTWDGAAYVAVTTGGAVSQNLTLITEASPFTADPGTHDGRNRLTLAGGDITFNSAEPYTAGMVFNFWASAALEILVSGVTLTDVSGGTKDLTTGMAVSVVMTGATTGIIIGQTVPL